ncbi:MAG: 4Fe-4S binding protein [Oscillospiraceae bacterium]|jgi:epoxyqueuosine reductase QueG|nr:4Fe-4S binding protein [Oscillospiraceae bacterium]
MSHQTLTQALLTELTAQGADLAGAGDLRALPAGTREGLPVGVAVAVAYPKKVIRGIAQLPTRDYLDAYHRMNAQLDGIVAAGARWLEARGFRAVAQTLAYAARFEEMYATRLPHKTVATRAGLGWIGKSALLVTPACGPMVRLSSLLTDAPLDCAAPTDESLCGACAACAQACPGGAISGLAWHAGLAREAFFDAAACRQTARARALEGFGIEISQCGKCIEVCPYTRHYLGGTGT